MIKDEKQCGKISLRGQFKKLEDIAPVNTSLIPDANLPKNLLKITIYRLEMNKKYF